MAGKSVMERTTNERRRKSIKVTRRTVGDINDKELIWFGHLYK